MSILTVPTFPLHLLKTVAFTQGLMTDAEYAECTASDGSEQRSYFSAVLKNANSEGEAYTEVAQRVWNAWNEMRREEAARIVVQTLEAVVLRTRVSSFLQWRMTDGHICEQSLHRLQGLLVRLTSENQELQSRVRAKPTVPSGQSFDSAVPASVKSPISFTRDSSGSCHDRLYAEAKEKEQMKVFFARVKVERETVGCTFRPDTASSTLSFANSQNCSVLFQSRHSTPCKSPEPSAPAPPQISPFDRLYQNDKERRAAHHHREEERLSKEAETHPFQPRILRSRTPEPKGSRHEQLHNVSLRSTTRKSCIIGGRRN